MPDEYRKGDIIRVTQTFEIEDVYAGTFLVRDVQTQEQGAFEPYGSARIEMVKRAPIMHNGPKPKAGAVLRGRHIKRIWWKRGTIFRLHDADVGGLVLREDAKLYPLSNLSDPDGSGIFEFGDLADDARFDLVYVA